MYAFGICFESYPATLEMPKSTTLHLLGEIVLVCLMGRTMEEKPSIMAEGYVLSLGKFYIQSSATRYFREI